SCHPLVGLLHQGLQNLLPQVYHPADQLWLQRLFLVTHLQFELLARQHDGREWIVGSLLCLNGLKMQATALHLLQGLLDRIVLEGQDALEQGLARTQLACKSVFTVMCKARATVFRPWLTAGASCRFCCP